VFEGRLMGGATLVGSVTLCDRAYVFNLGDSNCIIVDEDAPEKPMFIVTDSQNATLNDPSPSTERALKRLGVTIDSNPPGTFIYHLIGAFYMHREGSSSPIQPTSGLGDHHHLAEKIPVVTVCKMSRPLSIILGSDGSVANDADHLISVGCNLSDNSESYESKLIAEAEACELKSVQQKELNERESRLVRQLPRLTETKDFLVSKYTKYKATAMMAPSAILYSTLVNSPESKPTARQIAQEAAMVFEEILASYDDASVVVLRRN
jgi:hypothetical protein